MKIGLCQFNAVVGNPRYNVKRMVERMRQASERGWAVILFGELALSGYYSQDLFFNEEYIDEVNRAWLSLKEESDRLGIAVGTGMPRRNASEKGGCKHLYNSFCFYWPGKTEFTQDKVCLPTYAEFDEARWFQAGSLQNVQARVFGSYRVGFLICEDGWNNKEGVLDSPYRLYSEDPVESLVQQGVNVIVNISASPDYLGKQIRRMEMNQRIAKSYKMPIVFLNVVGAQDELVFGGQSFAINALGEPILRMKRCEEDLQLIDLEKMGQRRKRAVFPEPVMPMAELDDFLGLYLKDYLRKSGCELSKVILGLSGGKDSTAVAAILARHLGADRVIGVMMPYKRGLYTQEISRHLAKELAESLCITLREVSIDDEVASLMEKLGVKKDTIAHQNLQARVRAIILWGIANNENALVINTTNFSEAAMGYGTIGGDLLGLPLIASLPATIIIDYLKWLQREGVPAITDEMINREPSAELIPGQLDANELGEYAYIDPLIESLRMNFGDIRKVASQILDPSKKEYGCYHESEAARLHFFERLSFLAKKLLVNTEFKRWYYHKTPQLMPYSWLRWKWPVANAYMKIEELVAQVKKEMT
ncbi:MAG: NAD(+) synthase [Candidatus Margulisiibacteriota bacterium]